MIIVENQKDLEHKSMELRSKKVKQSRSSRVSELIPGHQDPEKRLNLITLDLFTKRQRSLKRQCCC